MEQSLDILHNQLREIKRDNNNKTTDIELIQEKIQATLPKVDTDSSLPQKKTPAGRTKVLHMNYMQSQTDKTGKTEIAHLLFFAKTARDLGLRLEILTDKNCRKDIEQKLANEDYKTLDYSITENQSPVSKWAEDSVEFLKNGQIAVLQQFNNELLEQAMTKGRRQRWQGKITPENLEEALRDDHLWVLLGIQVNTDKMAVTWEHVAQSNGMGVGHIRAYIEGGNMITGEDANGDSIILVGKDAIAATAHIYQLSNNAVRRLICEDFGLDSVEQVICVEQPGKFHLDMGLLFIGHGVVVVNNSSEALKDAIEMAEMVPCLTTEKMAAKLKLRCSLEDDAANDLAAAGLDVRRERLENDAFYNFFNGEFVEGQDGENYYITNGGPRAEEERFETLMTANWSSVKKVFFSPVDAAQKSLQERGGVGCRLKGSPL